MRQTTARATLSAAVSPKMRRRSHAPANPLLLYRETACRRQYFSYTRPRISTGFFGFRLCRLRGAACGEAVGALCINHTPHDLFRHKFRHGRI